MSNTITFDQLPTEVAKQGLLLIQIQNLLQELLSLPKDSQDEFLDVEETAKFLGLSKNTLYVKVSRREVPSIRRGKRLYFSKSDLIDYLNEGKRKTKDQLKDISNNYLKNKLY